MSVTSAPPPPRRRGPWAAIALGLAVASLISLALAHRPEGDRGSATLEERTEPDRGPRARPRAEGGKEAWTNEERHDGQLAVRVTAMGQPVVTAHVWLIPEDEAHQATAPTCPCSMAEEPDSPHLGLADASVEGEEDDAAEVVSSLAERCASCSANTEALIDLAQRGVGFLAVADATVDAQGEVIFRGLARATSYALWVEAPGFAAATASGVEAGDEGDPEVLKLEPAALARVRVEDSAGRIIPEAEVGLFVPTPFRAASLARHGDVFEVGGDHLPRGLAWVLAHAPGFLPALEPIEVGERADPVVLIALSVPLVLQGRVVHGGEGVAGAKVDAVEAESDQHHVLVADAQGRFSFPTLRSGRYTVSASRGDLRGRTEAFLGAYDTPPSVEVALRESARYRGVVLDAERSAPVAHASLELGDANGETQTGESDAEGRFAFRDLPPGRCSVHVSETDHLGTGHTVTLTEGVELTERLTLSRGLELKGRVVDSHDRPIANVRVEDQFPHNIEEEQVVSPDAESDEQGNFVLHGLPPGAQVLRAWGDGRPEVAVPVTLPQDSVVVRLADGASLDGTVSGPTGPLAGAEVVVRAPRHVGDREATTDAQGAFHLAGMTPGAIEVAAFAEGLAEGPPVPVQLAEGVTAHVELKLSPGQPVAGKVVDDRGAPIADASLEAYPEGGGAHLELGRSSATGTSDAQGRFELKGLGDGNYRLLARRDGLAQGDPVMTTAGATDVVVTLTRNGSVRGRVVSAAGGPVHRFQVEAQDVQSPDGAFVVRDIAPTTTEVEVSGEFRSQRLPVHVAPGDEVDLGTITVEAGQAITGVVLSVDRQPVEGAEVSATISGNADGDSDTPPSATTDAQGRFSLGHLGVGPYELTATAPAGTSAPRVASPGSTVELTLVASAEVHGTFTDASGVLYAEGVVEVSVGSVIQTGRVYGGAYRITGVPAGHAEVVGMAFSEHYTQRVVEAVIDVAPGQSVELNLVVPADRASVANAP